MGLSITRNDQAPRLAELTVRLTLTAVIGIWLARRVGRLLYLLVRSPFALITLAVLPLLVVFVVECGPWPLITIGAVLVGLLIVWRVVWPVGFGRVIGHPMRGRLRGVWVCRVRWTAAMDTAGLTVTYNGTRFVPTLGRCRSAMSVDRVRVRMLPG